MVDSAQDATMLRELWAKEQIRTLAGRYALAMDTRDESLMLSLWDDADHRAAFPDLDLGVVRDAVVPSWSSRGPSVMMLGQHLVDLESAERATGTVYCLVRIELGGRLVEQQVAYRDVYVDRGDGWRFATRRHLLAFGVAWPENPFAAPDAGWPRRQTGRGEIWEELR